MPPAKRKRNAGCDRFRTKVTEPSPSATISSRLRYHALRGLRRSLSFALPSRRSQVHLTSLAVNGLPSCHLTPWRSLKVSPVLSSSHDHSLARSGTIVLMLVCAICWSYMTKLLKTPIIGPCPAMVASSWIDMLAGLSKKYIFRTPPGFCASASVARTDPATNAPASASACPTMFISVPPLPLLGLAFARRQDSTVERKAANCPSG